jgi:hypothetical protein
MTLLAKALCLLGFAILNAALPFVQAACERHWESMKEWQRNFLAWAIFTLPSGFLFLAMPDFSGDSDDGEELTTEGKIAYLAITVYWYDSIFRGIKSTRA